ncbi:MAG: DNA polymerase III subunit epsilon [Arenimonas sp.]|nr:DNA polymerase III subunit epsilon [Arenimonas sp.]MBP6310381.1 DNA polymerase III subunit epsilon [Arenimonas sp.]
MRQVVLDTETTGLSWQKGNRLVEIGCIELINRRPTGRSFQKYLNPERDMEPGAMEVTGLTLDFLSDKPLFSDVVAEFLDFIKDAELIIHNAEFDLGFINNELSMLGATFGKIADYAQVLDTLKMAREMYPGQRNSLDALCKRLDINNKHRKLHGALLDAELLTDVYLLMTSGQTGFGFDQSNQAQNVDAQVLTPSGFEGRAFVLEASLAECAMHQERLDGIAAKSGKKLWAD